MTDLRPNKHIQKILISTTSSFVGEYEREDILITHAWPDFSTPSGQATLSENSLCRNSFVVSFRVEEVEQKIGEIRVRPNFSYMGDIICCYLSILFGKRFDSHGAQENIGQYFLPKFQLYSSFSRPTIPQNNHSARKDLEIPLNLVEIGRIEPLLLVDESIDERFIHFVQTAGRFYLQALQTFETQPEIAYLNLITAGEVLSNFNAFDKDNLLDDTMKALLLEVETTLDPDRGKKVVSQIKGRLLQVKRRFVMTICNLINSYFFSHSEAENNFTALEKDGFEERIAAAYDLRSIYLHTGITFGNCIAGLIGVNPEIQFGEPVVDNKEFQKALAKAPTFYGLERIIRFCLLRFIHLSGIRIDDRLDNDKTDEDASSN
jgi:hypothetical protein